MGRESFQWRASRSSGAFINLARGIYLYVDVSVRSVIERVNNVSVHWTGRAGRRENNERPGQVGWGKQLRVCCATLAPIKTAARPE